MANIEDNDSTNIISNYFIKLSSPSHHEMEVSDLILLYENIHHPVAEIITNLLESTYNFLCATAMDDFKEIRDETMADRKLIEKLNDMAKALQTAKKTYSAMNDNSSQQEVLSQAIEYSIQTVKERLSKLKTINDRYFDLYQSEKNDLRDILEI